MAEMEVKLGKWSKGQCDSYLRSMGLNKSINKIVHSTEQKNASCANNDIKCPIPKSWQTETLLDMFIEVSMHVLFLGIVKSIMEVSNKYMKDHKSATKFINRANKCITQVESVHVDYLQMSEWCLSIARVFPFPYGKLTIIIDPSIMHGNKYVHGAKHVYHGYTPNVTMSDINKQYDTIGQTVFGLLPLILYIHP